MTCNCPRKERNHCVCEISGNEICTELTQSFINNSLMMQTIPVEYLHMSYTKDVIAYLTSDVSKAQL